jgi:kynureninase
LFSRVLARERIYLANHSLGRPPDRTAEDVAEALAWWYRDLGDAWEHWVEEINSFRASTAQLVGAPRSDCIVPKTSAGQGLRAVLNSFGENIRVVTTRGEFDSIDFILKQYRERARIALTFVEPDANGWFHAEDIVAGLANGARLLVLSQVMFMSGQVVHGIEEIVAAAHQRGCLVLLDVYHAAGVIPVNVGVLDVDFAIGGSYKYLRGGPGACWLYVHPRHAARRTLDTGWFAKREPFGYARSESPEFANGGDAWLESTPPVLTPYQARSGLALTLALGVQRLRAYSLQQQQFLIETLRGKGIKADGGDEYHGAFVVVRHAEAGKLAEGLATAGVDSDARGSYLRLCPDILSGRAELVSAAERLRRLI